MTRRIHDISRTIASGGFVYPGDPPIALEPLSTIGVDGARCNMRMLHMNSHTLTHLDAPRHFVAAGATLDQLPVERFIGPALVVAAPRGVIEPEDLPGDELRGRNILFQTAAADQYETGRLDEPDGGLSGAAAEELVRRGVNLVGIDTPSIDRFGARDFPAHTALLGAGVLILEGIDLRAVGAGWYTLIALPLKLIDADGSPCRAVLVSD
ncbi:MAG TPA: cyclase family protein [Candidatus Sumerlaeota bacterium]|nr:cyclase family protein [Candidatus Sumerlaeota bacterium]